MSLKDINNSSHPVLLYTIVGLLSLCTSGTESLDCRHLVFAVCKLRLMKSGRGLSGS